jgi:hypothetical protein
MAGERLGMCELAFTVREAASLVAISSGAIQSILKHKLNMHHTAAKFALCIFRKKQ